MMNTVQLLPVTFLLTASRSPSKPSNRTSFTRAAICIKLRTTNRIIPCQARRRVRYEEEDEQENEYNEEILKLELYSAASRTEALVVHALLDENQVEVLIFKGFSSSLSFETASDLSRSILPPRAVIQLVDIVKGPFDPSNIQYLEKGIPWEDFKSRISAS